jgi:hypothetical protein
MSNHALEEMHTGCSIWMDAGRVDRASFGLVRALTPWSPLLSASLQDGFNQDSPVLLEVYGVPLVGKSRDDQIAYVLANPTCDQLRFDCVDGCHRVHWFANRNMPIYASLLFADDEHQLTEEVKVKIAVARNEI